MIEISLITALVAVAAIVIMTVMGATVSQVFSNVVCLTQGAAPTVFPSSPCVYGAAPGGFSPSPGASPVVSPSPALPGTSSNTLYAWGNNAVGQLADGTTTAQATPVSSILPVGTTLTAISFGQAHVLALTSTGKVLAWGNNNHGPLGQGSSDLVAHGTPTQVGGSLVGLTIVAIAAGQFHSLALDSTGQVWGWGYNNFGQAGNGVGGGSGADNLYPVAISGLPAGVTRLAAGQYHSMAMTSAGTVWVWGAGTSGQFGNGGVANSVTPTQVPGITGATAIGAGYYHNMAVVGGTVQIWGSYGSGNVLTPVTQAGIPAGITAVAGGQLTSSALTSTGTVWAWGRDNYGALGDGTTPIYGTRGPVQVSVLTGITKISNRSYTTVALKSNGTVWAWGQGQFGGTGNGTVADAFAPVQVILPVGYVAIAVSAGDRAGLAM